MRGEPLILRSVLSAIALIIVAWLGVGVVVESALSALVAAIILGFVNAFVRPILLLLTLPVNLFSLGLFTFVLNALLFWGVLAVVPGVGVTGFFPALFGSVLTGLLTWVLVTLARILMTPGRGAGT